MCIAVIKPAGVDMPSWETFETCFEGNPDGAGFAYSTGKNFVIRKGLQTFEAFKAALIVRAAAKGSEWTKATPMVFHFRIGTHGSQDDPKHTHPFPVSDSLKSLESLHIQCKQIAMHNGILSSWGTSHYTKKDPAKAAYSDTMDFIANFVVPLGKAIGPSSSLVTNRHAGKLIESEVLGSRFMIMDPSGEFALWGDWVQDSGCFYSNSGYKYVAPAYSSSIAKAYASAYGYQDWDDVDDCGWERARSWTKVSSMVSAPAPKLPACVDYRKLVNEETGNISLHSILGTKCTKAQAITTASQLGLKYVPTGTILEYGRGTKQWIVPKGSVFFAGTTGDLYEFDGVYSILYFEMTFERMVPAGTMESLYKEAVVG